MTHRFTIDYQEDYEFINAVYNELYTFKKLFTLDDILHLLKEKPELNEINEKYAGVNWYRNHLDELKTVKSNQTKII
jgi:spore coat polysaccharide biosynthesis protein SpsF